MAIPTIRVDPVDAPNTHRAVSLSVPIIWAYPLLIAGSELLTISVGPQAGLLAHLLLLIALVIHRALARRESEQDLALALLLAPLTRVLSLALPLDRFPQIAWYLIVAVPLIIAAWMVIRRLRLSRQALGLQPGHLLIQLMVAAGGLMIGVSAYTLLQPVLPASNLGLQTLWLPMLALMLCTGLVEEIIFRSILQATAVSVLGRWAVIYVALLFAALQIGYLSPGYLLLAAGAGLVFGYIVRLGKSILGVALAHGLANVTLMLAMPYLGAHPSSQLVSLLPWAVGVSTLLLVAAFALLVLRSTNVAQRIPGAISFPWRALQPPTPSNASVSAASIRALRLKLGVKYIDLAQRSGIPVRQLAEIEYGHRPLLPEHVINILGGLNITLQEALA